MIPIKILGRLARKPNTGCMEDQARLRCEITLPRTRTFCPVICVESIRVGNIDHDVFRIFARKKGQLGEMLDGKIVAYLN